MTDALILLGMAGAWGIIALVFDVALARKAHKRGEFTKE